MNMRCSVVAVGVRASQCAALALVLSLSGCEGNGEAAPQPKRVSHQQWSTKEQSVVLGSVGGARLNVPDQELLVADESLRHAAIDLLVQAGESEYALLRANAIEGLRHAPSVVEQIAVSSLTDENRGVRFTAAMTIGMLQLKSSSHLLEPLLHDPSDSVRAAAMYGLRRCGRMVDLNPLAQMLYSEDPEIKGNAALVLGELGDETAAPMVRDAVGRSLSRVGPVRRRIVELQLAEAMVKLGMPVEIEGIRAALFTTAEQGEIAALACLIVGRLGDRDSLQTLEIMTRDVETGGHAPEVRLAAATAIAQIEPSLAPIDVPLQFAASERPELRAQAAMSLGKFREAAALGQLRVLLGDPDPMVQVSAAAAILELLPEETSLTG